MDQLAIEQKANGNGYQPAGIQQGAKSAVNLGGFAISFEELLERVGAHLGKGFSAVDQTSSLSNAARRDNANSDRRDDGSDRTAKASDRGDDRSDRYGRADERSSSKQVDRTDTAPRQENVNTAADDSGADRQVSRDDGATADTHADTGDKHSDADGAKKSGDTKAADGTEETGKSDHQNGKKKGSDTNANGAVSGAEQHAAAQQAVTAYAAGALGNVVSDHATNVDPAAAASEGASEKAVTDVNVVIAANTGRKGVHTQDNAGQHNVQQQAKSAGQNAQAQQAAQTEPAKESAIRDQAQQLSKIIGEGTKANVSVNVTNEQSQLTSRPSLAAANASVLSADASSSQQAGQQAQNATQHQAAPNAAAVQVQTAQTQQAQNAGQQQQANGPQAVNGAAGADAKGGVAQTAQNASGAAQHAGNSEGGTPSTQSTGAGTQQTQQTQQSRETAQAHAQQAPRAQMPGQPIVDQISVKITKALQAGNDKISIQLKPEDLGRVDVKMELTHDGRVMAVVTADKQDTLDLLRRDASELQRALADAGLKTDAGDMQFNLRGDQGQTANDEGGKGQNGRAAADAPVEEEATGDGVVAAWQSGIYNNGRLDVRA